jgi:hypothetical protein
MSITTLDNGGGSNGRPSIGTGELAAGGGSGGILVYAINAYIIDPKLQTLLIYLVPAVSVAATGLYGKLIAVIQSRQEDKAAEKKRMSLLKRAQSGLAEAKQQLQSIEDDKNATPDHKKTARERVQAFERAVLDLHAKGIVTIEPNTVS